MANYTKLNLREEVEDQAPKFGMSTDMEFRQRARARSTSRTRASASSGSTRTTAFRSGTPQRAGRGLHPRRRERALKLDDEILELKPWDAVRIHKETMRNFEGGPEGAEIIAVRRAERGARRRRRWRRAGGPTDGRHRVQPRQPARGRGPGEEPRHRPGGVQHPLRARARSAASTAASATCASRRTGRRTGTGTSGRRRSTSSCTARRR